MLELEVSNLVHEGDWGGLSVLQPGAEEWGRIEQGADLAEKKSIISRKAVHVPIEQVTWSKVQAFIGEEVLHSVY